MNNSIYKFFFVLVVSLHSVLFGTEEASLPLLDRGNHEALSILRESSTDDDIAQVIFKGLKYEDCLSFLAQRVLIIDDESYDPAVVSATITLDELESANSLEAIDYHIIIKATSELLDFPKQLGGEFDVLTYAENRSKMLLRGSIGLQRLRGEKVDYPVVSIELGASPSATLQRDVNAPEELVSPPHDADDDFASAILTHLKKQHLAVRTVFVGGPSSDVITQYTSGKEQILDRQTTFLLGGLHTALSMYRLLPEKEILFASEPRPLTHEEMMRRYLRYAHQLGRGLLSFAENDLKPMTLRSWYWLEVFRLGHLGVPAQQCWTIIEVWEEDRDTSLLPPEWTMEKQQEWRDSGSPVTFHEWLVERLWLQSQSPLSLDMWTIQVILGLEPSQMSLFQFSDDVRLSWETRYQNIHLTLDEYVQLYFRYLRANSSMPFEIWCYYLDFQKEGSPGDFEAYVLKSLWERAVAEGTTKATESEWIQQSLYNDHKRWSQQGFEEAGMTFETYRLIQSQKNWYGADRPFAALDSEQRHAFQVTIKNGHLYRNGKPFSTESERTWHSGPGYVIFIMDCNGSLYAASHGIIFFHSSFMANGPVAMAGELKTDKNGKIVYISNKSGHYAPGKQAIVRMLHYFERNGVNLAETAFDHIGSAPNQFANAEDFLRQTERTVVQR